MNYLTYKIEVIPYCLKSMVMVMLHLIKCLKWLNRRRKNFNKRKKGQIFHAGDHVM